MTCGRGLQQEAAWSSEVGARRVGDDDGTGFSQFRRERGGGGLAIEPRGLVPRPPSARALSATNGGTSELRRLPTADTYGPRRPAGGRPHMQKVPWESRSLKILDRPLAEDTALLPRYSKLNGF